MVRQLKLQDFHQAPLARRGASRHRCLWRRCWNDRSIHSGLVGWKIEAQNLGWNAMAKKRHVLFNGTAMFLGDLQYLKFLNLLKGADGVLKSGSKRKWMAACYRSIESIGIFGCFPNVQETFLSSMKALASRDKVFFIQMPFLTAKLSWLCLGSESMQCCGHRSSFQQLPRPVLVLVILLMEEILHHLTCIKPCNEIFTISTG